MYNNYPSDGSKKIATVMAVDIPRKVCKCMSDTGEILTDVRWVVPMGGNDGAGSSSNPVESSRVLIDVSSGFPFILGAIHSEGTYDVERPRIYRQSVDDVKHATEDIANYTTIKTGPIIRGPGTPRDQNVGDTVTTSDGGAIQGVLRSGTVINKASPFSQLILSRYGDVARLVSRNFEHFTDVDQTIKASAQGNVFAAREVYQDPASSRTEAKAIEVVEGNIPAADALGKDYATNGDGVVAPDDVVKRTSTFDTDQLVTSVEELERGAIHKRVTTYGADGVATSVEEVHRDGTHDLKIGTAIIVTANPDGSYHLTGAEGAFTLDISSAGAVTMAATDVAVTSDTLTYNTSGDTSIIAGGALVLQGTTVQIN